MSDVWNEAVAVGSTVTVIVLLGVVTVTTTVRVLRPVALVLSGAPVAVTEVDPVGGRSDESTDVSPDSPDSKASGIEPRTCFARVASVQPRIAPEVEFIGMTRQT